MEANGTWFQTLALWQHLHRDDVVWGGGRGGGPSVTGKRNYYAWQEEITLTGNNYVPESDNANIYLISSIF